MKIPATVITGFLGAGKTTLIRHLLSTAGGRRIALVINEFGDIGIDRALLEGCGDETCQPGGINEIVELANGCLCCTVADEFLPTIEALLARPQPPHHIVVETSGLALPKPLIKAFQWPEVRSRVTVDGVVTVIDAEAVAAGRFATDLEALAAQKAADPTLDHDNPLEEVFVDQLASADLVLLNKSDRLDGPGLDAVKADLAARLRPGAKLVPTRFGAIDAAVLLGLGAAAEDDLASRPSVHDAEDEHDHEDFESFALVVPPMADPAGFEPRLKSAIEAHDILRIKGFLDVPGKPMRHVVQAVGARIERYYDRPWRADENRRGTLVVIGQKGLDREAIIAALGV